MELRLENQALTQLHTLNLVFSQFLINHIFFQRFHPKKDQLAHLDIIAQIMIHLLENIRL